MVKWVWVLGSVGMVFESWGCGVGMGWGGGGVSILACCLSYCE